jgi:uncharacterized protein (DUF305 family)
MAPKSKTQTYHPSCLLAALAVFTSASLGLAEENAAAKAQDHSQHAAPAAAQGELTEASKAYEEAMQKMHKDMSVPYSGDVDLDFVRGMMPHHQGAIDQAKVLLKYSKNLRLRRLAGGIIAAQRREINFMKHWLEEHEKGVESTEMPEWMKNAPVKADGTPADAAPE